MVKADGRRVRGKGLDLMRNGTLADAQLNHTSSRYMDWAVFVVTVLVGLSIATGRAARAAGPDERPAIEVVQR